MTFASRAGGIRAIQRRSSAARCRFANGEYTVEAVFGSEAETVRADFAANTRAIGDQLSNLFRSWPGPGQLNDRAL
ncbi:MAG: hypothetical protein JO095_03535 [Alphaproteobacteria bacterium]|nr:hypothetical protein [Alphaproteobacteria bacterium]